jgi:uncharacterized protein YkwD
VKATENSITGSNKAALVSRFRPVDMNPSRMVAADGACQGWCIVAGVRRFLVLAAMVGCATPAAPPPDVTPPPAAAPSPEEPEEPGQADLGPASARYQTAAQPGGVVGGRMAEDLARAVADLLRARGAEPEPDGALARTAGWYLGEWAIGRRRDAAEGDRVARHFGFSGPLLGAVAFSLTEHRDQWQAALTQVAANMIINRFGVKVSPGAGLAAVVIGAVEATLDPFARRLAAGETLRLRGELASRFKFGHLYLTGPDGKVLETRLPGRKLEQSLALPVAGAYKVEVMGDGASGPVIVVNVPVYVGVPEPGLAAAAAPGPAAAPAALAEGRLLTLLNEARGKAGLPPLAPDPELRALALGHTEDMTRSGFFGHVSPNTGSAEDRARRAGVVLAVLGENIAQAATPELAHDSLMDSPGHRANMLRKDFTHVGIAVIPLPPPNLTATLVFGRRASAGTEATTAAQVLETIAALRTAKGVPPLARDRAFEAAAQAGIRVVTSGGAPERALAAANASLAAARDQPAQSRARRGCVQLYELVELSQLGQYPMLVDARVKRIGAAVAPRRRGNATVLAVVILIDGASCG